MPILLNTTTFDNVAYLYKGTSGGTVKTKITDANSFDYFSDSAVLNDFIAFGGSREFRYEKLKLYVGTALTGVGITITWEYFDINGVWQALADVTDNTNGFTVTGENTVEWTVPTDWTIDESVQMSDLSYIYQTLWIRARISAITSITEGGAQSTQSSSVLCYAIMVDGDYSASTNIFEQVYDEDQLQGWGRSGLTKRGITINCAVWFGRNSITTAYSQNERASLYYDNFRIYGNCTFRFGLLNATGFAHQGSVIEISGEGADYYMTVGGSLSYFYSTQLQWSGFGLGTRRIAFGGETHFDDFVFEGFTRFMPYNDLNTIKRVKLKPVANGLYTRFFPYAGFASVEDFMIQSNASMCATFQNGTFDNVAVESSAAQPNRNFQGENKIRNSPSVSEVITKWTFGWYAGDYTEFQKSVNLHITDKNGGAIADTATISCTRANVVTESAKFYKCIEAHTSGTFATDLAAGKWEEITDATILDAAPAWLTGKDYVSEEAVFSENPTGGDMAEQYITNRKFSYLTSSTASEVSYIFKFTISETGYETLVLDNKVIGSPIEWDLQLQDEVTDAEIAQAVWEYGNRALT